MTENKLTFKAHLAASLTLLIWGTTFISTKVLLRDFEPVEILFFRFALGFIALYIACPKRLKLTDCKQEWYFVGAGLCGVTLYFLLENIALTYSYASNVGVILAIAPCFTAIAAHFFLKEEKLKLNFFPGFLTAIAGVGLISFNGSTAFSLNPVGDILAILAAMVWAFYSVLTKKIGGFGYSTVQATRKIFLYGLILMIPALFIFEFHWEPQRFLKPVCLLNILYLGLGASALCFVTWNFAVKVLGAVKTSVYIYAGPIITVVTSVLILHERITWMSFAGIVLTIAGLVISQLKINIGKKKRQE